jgi:hypothetical protein
MHFETLYKTNRPEDMEHAEYYQPQLDLVFVNGAWSWFVREKHGWWDGKKAVNHTTTLSPEEGVSEIEARSWFEKQQKFRASEGFRYAFSIDYFAPGGAIVWREIK